MIPRLTPLERVVAWRLSEGRTVSRSELIKALYGDDPEGGPLFAERNVYIIIYELRRCLSNEGLSIVTLPRVGWYVDNAERLRAALIEELKAAPNRPPRRRRRDRKSQIERRAA